jgi:hypothetical protein
VSHLVGGRLQEHLQVSRSNDAHMGSMSDRVSRRIIKMKRFHGFLLHKQLSNPRR